MLLDSASLYFRAFHALPESLTAPDGSPVNAVRGFCDMVARLVSTRRPSRLVACLDADWRPAFRVAAVPSYKEHRVGPDGGEAVPEALVAQVPVIEQVLDAVGIARLGVAGFEADDVIATLAAREPDPVEVVSGDRDLFGVVRDAGGGRGPVRVLYTGRGLARLEVCGPAEVAARYGIPGRAYPDFAVLRGDPSDGLPGVVGVGDKTAAALVSRFGSLPALLEALDRGERDGFPAGARRRLTDARDYLDAAWQVVRAREDVPVPDPADMTDGLPAAPADPAALVDLSTRWGLDSVLSRLLRALRDAHPQPRPDRDG
jgi:5''-3'' exonuclease (including N-terminal domain of PolI)